MLYNPLNIFFEKARLLFQRRVQDGQLAYLGDTDGPGARVEIPDRIGYVYARFPGGKDSNGDVQYSPPFPVRSAGAAFTNAPGTPVYIAYGRNGEAQIVESHYAALDQAGIDTRILNPLHQQAKWVYLWQLTMGMAAAVANSVNTSYLVTIKRFLHYSANVFQFFETGAQADKIDLQAYVPAVDMQCYAAVWLDTYTNTAEVTVSTAQSLFSTLDDTDINELVADRPPDAIPHKAFWLANDQGTVTIQAANDIDLRQFLNMPQLHGFNNPVAYRERIQPDRQQLFTGILEVTGTLEVLGVLVGVPSGCCGGGGVDEGITQLTGDVTAGPGSGSQAATLATVNSNVGSFAAADITVNGKGLVTAAAAAASTGTGSVVRASGPTVTSPVINTGVSGTAIDDDATFASPSTTKVPTTQAVNTRLNLRTWKQAVNFASAAALPACTYANGSSGVGATLTANANGALSINGTAQTAGNRVLIKDESPSFLRNGIYVVTDAGSAGTPWILTRATDMDTGAEFPGAVVYCIDGSTNQNTYWSCTRTTAPTVGTDSVQFQSVLGGFANTSLSNLGTVNINTTLKSDTDNTDDLGTSAAKWRELFTFLATFEERSTPSAPATNDVQHYAKAVGSGAAEFSQDDQGNEYQLSPMFVRLIDSKTANTAGGTSSSTTWNARDLNTEEYDPYGLATISSNKFVLVAGTYIGRAYSTFLGGTAANSSAQNRIFNVTAATEVWRGENATAVTNSSAVAIVDFELTSNGTDEYRVDTYTTVGRTTNGLGLQLNAGITEKYTVVVLEKIG